LAIRGSLSDCASIFRPSEWTPARGGRELRSAATNCGSRRRSLLDAAIGSTGQRFVE